MRHYDNLIKPDLVAPGNRIIGAYADENFLAANYNLSLGAAGAPLGTLVPEPASLAGLVLIATTLISRRRR